MKKLVKRIMAMLLVCTVVGSALFGGIAEAASNQTKAKKYLNSATKDCKKVMDTIDSSWYFQVYEDYSGKSVIYNYALSVGISQSKVKKIIKKKYGKNAVMKANNLQNKATAIERNGQIGGHRA